MGNIQATFGQLFRHLKTKISTYTLCLATIDIKFYCNDIESFVQAWRNSVFSRNLQECLHASTQVQLPQHTNRSEQNTNIPLTSPHSLHSRYVVMINWHSYIELVPTVVLVPWLAWIWWQINSHSITARLLHKLHLIQPLPLTPKIDESKLRQFVSYLDQMCFVLCWNMILLRTLFCLDCTVSGVYPIQIITFFMPDCCCI